jgi:hypothetical protein
MCQMYIQYQYKLLACHVQRLELLVKLVHLLLAHQWDKLLVPNQVRVEECADLHLHNKWNVLVQNLIKWMVVVHKH